MEASAMVPGPAFVTIKSAAHTHTHTHAHARAHAHTHTHTHARTHTHTHARTGRLLSPSSPLRAQTLARTRTQREERERDRQTDAGRRTCPSATRPLFPCSPIPHSQPPAHLLPPFSPPSLCTPPFSHPSASPPLPIPLHTCNHPVVHIRHETVDDDVEVGGPLLGLERVLHHLLQRHRV